VLTESENVEKAVQTYESTAYQAAVKVLEGAVARNVRIVEGVE
jgi:uncharacterized protein (DUF1330 family)